MATTTLDPATGLNPDAVDALVHARHGDPFSLLGPHPIGDTPLVRAFFPGADAVEVRARGGGDSLGTLGLVHPAGLFAGPLSRGGPYVFHVRWPDAVQETEDPYSFGLLLGELDLHLFAEGNHYELGRVLGAQPMAVEGVAGTRFSVWAPNARRVSVIGDFNSWDGRRHPMRLRAEAGVWELFVPRVGVGERYKFELTGPDGQVLPQKADPMARASEAAPATASIVARAEAYAWTDQAWMEGRAARHRPDAPISVYEIHAGSWLMVDGRSLDWDEMIDRLVPYVAGMGFTHVELLPIMEHPFGGSWGYQPLGLFAPTGRYGRQEDFARFVDRCHAAGVGVILDWVPAHFPTDAHGLVRFDGTPLYEHADPREGYHQDWNTLIYNLGRNEVRGFLLASACEWLERWHIDGLRVDAVASMLYRDYSRKAGEWVPNKYGGRENLESVDFLKHLNGIVRDRNPGAMTIAEESTAWPGVSAPLEAGGLGFQYKWNMGWMHDSLHYMEEDPINRRWHHDSMTFGMVYAWSEKFMLPLSHDEVVHGKGSLLNKMPGDPWQKRANLRAYYGFMWAHPGKKLLFMGCEIGQWREWNHDASLDWHLLDDPGHAGIQALVRDLNRLYTAEPALHATDAEPAGFTWAVGDDRENSVFAFLRNPPAAGTAEGSGPVLAVSNFTPVPRHDYRIGVPRPGFWREIVNTDAAAYGGSGLGNGGGRESEPIPAHGHPQSLALTVPPLATVWLKPA
ncbi:1,4-alpha-glucan branching protein GlgB [Mongoliimonas terrestris]|uniref:1,4-alpha-glucan branching protein GlgB n=1 Tax=Mongoliimonas terrestris TaxID=1709001 RepID=UPI0009495F7F|nr:1,4-alpha-glucan branching protein GlgB [Mongoliimonas terrestris]